VTVVPTKILAKDLKADMIFSEGDQLYRVVHIAGSSTAVAIEAKRQTVLGEISADFYVQPLTEFQLTQAPGLQAQRNPSI
jgi:hypothetical protein